MSIWKKEYKQVLCVCEMGLLRSPTTAWVLSRNPYNYDTRSCGIDKLALIRISDELLLWADEIVCMNTRQQQIVITMISSSKLPPKPTIQLNIPDIYDYRNKTLIKLI